MRTIRFSWILAALMVISHFTSAETPLDLPLQWTANLNTYLETAATLADIDGDGLDEAVVAGREELVALDGDGTELWRWKTKVRFITLAFRLPALELRPMHGDEANQAVKTGMLPLIYTADTGGQLSCVDGNGKEVWLQQLSGPATWTSSVVCDLTGDGVPEVVQADDRGEVGAFNALDGTVIWKTKVQGDALSPAVADLDGDGLQEIAITTCDGFLFLLNAQGEILWSKKLGADAPSWAGSSPIFFGASDGSSRIAVSANEGRVYCLDPAGNTLWEQPLNGPTASSLSVGDIDQDGRADIFAITQTGMLYRFEEDGSLRWNIDMQGRCLAGGRNSRYQC